MNKTVLIIDDDEVLRGAIAHGLRTAGFNAITAESADDGDKVLCRMTVDAIVLDRMMVGTDGLTFLKSLRAGGNSTPVIMLTAMTGAENAIDGLSGGANDYLGKPFQMRELILRLENIMRARDAVAPQLPTGLIFADNEFFVDPDGTGPRMLGLSGEEKRLLINLTSPVGNIAPAAPMVAKRLRGKLNGVLSDIDIITIRGRGYKLMRMSATTNTKDDDK